MRPPDVGRDIDIVEISLGPYSYWPRSPRHILGIAAVALLIALLMSPSMRLCDTLRSCPMRHRLFAWIWMTVSIVFRTALGRNSEAYQGLTLE
jgi:hypothetical protein